MCLRSISKSRFAPYHFDWCLPLAVWIESEFLKEAKLSLPAFGGPSGLHPHPSSGPRLFDIYFLSERSGKLTKLFLATSCHAVPFHMLTSITGHSQWITILCYRFIVISYKAIGFRIDWCCCCYIQWARTRNRMCVGYHYKLGKSQSQWQSNMVSKWKISSFQVFITSEA